MRKLINYLLVFVLLVSTLGCTASDKNQNENTSLTDNNQITDFNVDYSKVQQEMSNFMCESNYYIYDGWIYTVSFPLEGGSGLLAKMRTDGSDYFVLTDKGTPYYITVDGEYIYTILGSSEFSRIYKCRLGGNGLTQLVDTDVLYLQVVEDYLYYNKLDKESGRTTGYYRCDKNGANEEIVLDKEIYYGYIVGNDLYYQDDNDGETIHRYNMETKEDIRITNERSYAFVVDGEYGYYIGSERTASESNYTGNLVKINLLTKEETVLYENASTSATLLKDEKLYFINANDENRIYCINKDGTGIKLVSQDTNCSSLATYNDYLLYTDFDSNNEYVDGLYISNMDGSDKINLMDWIK